MGVFDSFRLDNLVQQIATSTTLSDPAAEKSIAKLQKMAKTAIPKLSECLATCSVESRAVIIEALSDLANAQSIEYFYPLLAHGSAQVRDGVTTALANSPDVNPNKVLLRLTDKTLSKPALVTILTAHQKRLNPVELLKFIYKLDHSEQIPLFRLLQDVADESVVPELINRLDSKDALVRAQLVKILSKFDTQPVHQALQRMLNDENKAVRLAALDGLNEKHVEMDVEDICRLIDDGDFAVQTKAVETIVSIRHPKTVEHLIPYLKSDSEYTRRAAVEVLNEIADAQSVRDLFNVIRDQDWWVRSRAADALGKIGGPKVVQSVLLLLKDKDEFIRRSAIEIINATKDESTYNALISALDDSDWWVRERAIDGLAELGNKQAIPLLIKLLQRNQENESTAIILLQALRKLEAKSAVPYVIKTLWSEKNSVVKEAIQCLVEISDETNLEEITSSLEHATENADEDIKELAEDAINRILDRQSAVATDVRESIRTRTQTRSRGDVSMAGTVIRGRDELTPATVDPTKLKPDDVLAGRYRFIRQVGKGAFGAVFLMEDLMINEEVILKFLNAQFASDDSVIKRFIYELRFARKVTHPNVIRIFDLITFGEASAISMEYFNSHTLGAEFKDKKPMEISRALQFAKDVCSGMASAHKAEVIHRDLKPNNILINDQDEVKVVDFGIAAARQSSDTKLTRTGLLVGTPTYMSPEQVLGKEIDERTDIYSIGTIMYEMLSGRPPYSGSDSMAVMYQHVQGKATPLKEKNPLVSEALSDLVAQCMAVKTDERIQTMQELYDRLDVIYQEYAQSA